MEGEGRKALKRPLETEDEFGRIFKRPCDDRVENSASATDDAAFGTHADVTGGSIFKILAGRKALKCPREEDVVASASATTTGEKALKRPFVNYASGMDEDEDTDTDLWKGNSFWVENPISSSSTTTGTEAKVRRPSAYPAGYAFIEYPDANAYSPEIPHEEFLEGSRIVAKVASCCYEDRPKVASERLPLKVGVQPPVPNPHFRESPLYKAAVASGAKVVVNGDKWKATIKGKRYYY